MGRLHQRQHAADESEFDDEDGILGRQANERDEADLRQDVDLEMAEEESADQMPPMKSGLVSATPLWRRMS